MSKTNARITRHAGACLLCALAFIGLFATRAHADALRVMEEKVGPVPEFIMPLKAGQVVTFQTVNLSGGIDPVLHLWDITNGFELGLNDNGGGGKAALLRVVVPHIGNYALIVRQRNIVSEGMTDILKDGQPFRRNVQVAGRFIFLLSLKEKEQIDVLPPPAGAPAHFAYLISDDGLHIESRLRGAPRSRFEIPAGFFGARTLLLGVRAADNGKPLRIYRNDVKLPGADPDGDGLGTGLEQQLKTCSVKTDSFDIPCDRAVDMRDTDGDGIPDGWEVLGRDFSPNVYVPLPTWGANPRHKDLFIEADYRRLSKQENDERRQEHMPPEVARGFAGGFADHKTTDPLIRLFHATLVGNPDQQPGINVHFDTGVEPERPEDAAIYGDWGGYQAIDAVAGADGNFGGAEVDALWKTHMHPSRRGIFRYGPGHRSGGAQCPVGRMFCGYNFNNAGNAMHEMMHTLGLNHSGPEGIERLGANCKSNYPSTVNYAYINDLLVSDGRNRAALNNVALKETRAVSPSNRSFLADLKNKYRFIVDENEGHVDWDRDGAFAPADRTVRGYANYEPGNDCEFTRLNQVKFAGTVATSVAVTRVGKHTLLFYLDAQGRVFHRRSTSDWDCPAAEFNCAGSSFGSPVQIDFPLLVKGMDAETVNVTGAGEQVSLVVIDSLGRLRERRLELQANGTLTLSPTTTPLIASQAVTGEPSLAETRDGRGLYLVYKGTDNVVRWRFRNTSQWSPERVAEKPDGTVLIAAPDASAGIASAYLPSSPGSPAALYLAFSEKNAPFRLYTLNAQEKWELTDLLSDQGLRGMKGRPSMAWVPNTTSRDTPGQFYLVMRDDRTRYRMMRTHFDPGAQKVRVGLTSFFDNSSLKGDAIDITASAANGHPQLWAALTFTNRTGPNLLFRPRADGIVDIKQANYDDWSVIAWGTCQFIINPDDGDTPHAARCSPRPF
ncbi:MAG TPA: hypothetical protein VF656_03995 [Pyrinomonadaceae bacterium]|jgi:hypothetical protein